MELEESATPFEPVNDKTPRMFEPLPARLVAVEDCRLPTVAGLETKLDDFYVKLLGFEREPASGEIVYRAENHRLRFDIHETLFSRESVRPLGVLVDSLPVLVQRFLEAQIEYTRQRGITPGLDSLLLQDPAGNSVEISEYRIVI